MNMVGVIFDNRERMEEQFQRHAASVMYTCDTGFVVSASKKEIVAGGVKWMYILIADDFHLNKIAGIPFDAIFSEVTNLEHKHFIMTRFRPRFDK